MSREALKQRLAAILAADAAGYSRLMAVDEHATVAALDAARAVFRTQIEANQGRVVDMAGDSVLAVFELATSAVSAAVAIQAELNGAAQALPQDRRMLYRIGVHTGEIIEKIDGTVYGDGINVAARIQGLTDAGAVCVSGTVHSFVRGKVAVEFEDLGAQVVKNIAEPVRVYRVQTETAEAASPKHQLGDIDLSLPDKPSLAVLPFTNMSGDREQEYFADGIVEDIITALSRMHSLFVIARNSSFTYKGRAVDVKQVGRELGVRYVLEGSVRKAANRVRITGQLIDAGNGVHLWADRFDGALEDIFDLQDRVTTSIVNAIAPKLEHAEIERAKHKPTESLDAYDYYLRGTESFYQQTRESTVDALKLFSNAIQLDPDFAAAYAMAAMCHTQNKAGGWVADRAQETAEAGRLARRAVDLGKDDAFALARAGHTLAYVNEDFDAGTLFIDRACVLNANLAAAWYASGWLRVWIGEPATAIDHLERFVRISPLDPLLARVYSAVAFAHVFTGQYEEAVRYAERSISENPNAHQALRAVAISNALAGRIEKARKAVLRLREISPALCISNLRDQTPLQRPDDMARYSEAMRKAGLPE